MKKILFVCSANTCRSAMAEYLAKEVAKSKSMCVEIYSAGLHAMIGDSAVENAIVSLKNLGINMQEHRSKRINQELIRSSDYIVAMDKNIKLELCIYFPHFEKKIFYIGDLATRVQIKDPFGKPLEYFEEAAKEINIAVTEILNKLGENNESSCRI